LDGTDVHLIHVGPAHQVADVVVHVPTEVTLFVGHVVFHECTPMGWAGSPGQFFRAIETIIDLHSSAIVPGRGPIYGVEALQAEKAYFQHVHDGSRACFNEGLTAQDAAKRSQLGDSGEWKAPAGLALNVDCAYREFAMSPRTRTGICRRSSTPSTTWRRPEALPSSPECARPVPPLILRAFASTGNERRREG
jgi:glyoxylase-like metal-dependent hydrolase (beta-lactamase superfamily II)